MKKRDVLNYINEILFTPNVVIDKHDRFDLKKHLENAAKKLGLEIDGKYTNEGYVFRLKKDGKAIPRDDYNMFNYYFQQGVGRKFMLTFSHDLMYDIKSNKRYAVIIPDDLYEATTVGSAGLAVDGSTQPGDNNGGGYLTKLWSNQKKEIYEKLEKEGDFLVIKENGEKVTPSHILEWFGQETIDDKLDQPFYQGGKVVQIKPKCATFPYCSQGDLDKPIKLIGETKEENNPLCWEYLTNVANKYNKTPEYVAKIIREEYRKKGIF